MERRFLGVGAFFLEIVLILLGKGRFAHADGLGSVGRKIFCPYDAFLTACFPQSPAHTHSSCTGGKPSALNDPEFHRAKDFLPLQAVWAGLTTW